MYYIMNGAISSTAEYLTLASRCFSESNFTRADTVQCDDRPHRVAALS